MTRALVALGHPVTLVESDMSSTSLADAHPVISADDPGALQSAIESHDVVVNLEPALGEPRSSLGPLRSARPGAAAYVS